MISGRDSQFRGTQGTAILGAFGGAVAWTGVNEKTLVRLGDDDFEKIYLYPNSHAGYYPGATLLAIKVIFRKSDGRLLGAQAVGREGVDKRIDALAMAIQLAGPSTTSRSASSATRRGSAREVARQLRRDGRGQRPPRRHAARPLGRPGDGFLLDVRHPEELAVGAVAGRGQHPDRRAARRLDELPRDREILVVCRSGQRAYYATRILLQNGFAARTVAGGMLSHEIFSEV